MFRPPWRLWVLLGVISHCFVAAAAVVLVASQANESAWGREAEILAQQIEWQVKTVSNGSSSLIDPAVPAGIEFLLQDQAGRPIAGTLRDWPPEVVRDGQVFRVAEGAALNLFASAQLTDGRRLLVARSGPDPLPGAAWLIGRGAGLVLMTLVVALAIVCWTDRKTETEAKRIKFEALHAIDRDPGHRIDLVGATPAAARSIDTINGLLDFSQSYREETRLILDLMAHDLRSPATRLHNQIEALMARDFDAAEMRAGLAQAKDSTDRMMRTLSDLLEIARAEASVGVWAAEFGEVEVASLFREISELYRPVAEEQHFTLTHEALPWIYVWGQSELLVRAISNLIENAIKYSDAGAICLQALVDGNLVKLSVSDPGPGIPFEYQQSALQRFTRLPRASKGESLGLGLTLAVAIFKLHGAQLGFSHPNDRFSVDIVFDKPSKK